jgi:hypothetical protein
MTNEQQQQLELRPPINYIELAEKRRQSFDLTLWDKVIIAPETFRG